MASPIDPPRPSEHVDVTRPIELLAEGAERFASGRFAQRLPSSYTTEIGTMATSMNRMAANLSQRMETIDEEVLAKTDVMVAEAEQHVQSCRDRRQQADA